MSAIYSCCNDKIKENLKELFPKRYIKGVIKADWVTGKVIAPKGKRLLYVHAGYESIYETELEFSFTKGKLTEIKVYDNSGSRQSVFSQNSRKLVTFVHSEIRWDSLPEFKSIVRVFVKFSANASGKIDSVKVVKSSNDLFNTEAVRAVKSIPEWDVYLRHGKHERIPYIFPVVFSEESKKKYSFR